MLQIVRRSYQDQGLSDEVIDVLLKAWRDSTVKQYKGVLVKWTQFCARRSTSSTNSDVVEVLEFFNSLDKNSTSYSAINTARSALSSVVTLRKFSVGTHPLVSKFMKGVFNKRLGAKH